MPQLLWKEWHEQAWKLGFGCIVLGTLAALAFRARLLADDVTAMWICYIGLTLLPMLAATGLIPAERGDGTLEMLLALPLPRWRVLLVNALTGVALVAAPLLLAAIISLAISRGREISTGSMASLYLRSIAAAAMLLAWMIALTIRLPSEARAGLIAVGVLIIWELATVGLTQKPFPIELVSVSPLAFVYGFTTGFTDAPPLLLLIAAQLASLGLLTLATLWQFRPNSVVA